MPEKTRMANKYCHACGNQLNTWDVRVSNTLKYRNPVCEKCIAKEYDKEIEWLRDYFEHYFGMRPCAGI